MRCQRSIVKLKVYGLDGLRIADASILPRVTTGNTMAPCVVIGEQAARSSRRRRISVALPGLVSNSLVEDAMERYARTVPTLSPASSTHGNEEPVRAAPRHRMVTG